MPRDPNPSTITPDATRGTRVLDPEHPAPPLDYDPSSMRQRVRVALLGSIAAGISVYLGLYQWGVIDTVWDPLFGTGTATVLDSPESLRMQRIIGIPDAIFGAWAYLTEVVLSLVGSRRRWQFRPWLVVLFGLDVIPLGLVSVTLVILQGLSVGSWCFLCLVTAGISLLLMFLVYDEVLASGRYLWRTWTAERDPVLLWQVFWGRASGRAADIAYEVTEGQGRAVTSPATG